LKSSTSSLKYASVRTYLEDYLKVMAQPTFYMATDDKAVSHLEK